MQIRIHVRRKLFILGQCFHYFENLKFRVRPDATFREVAGFIHTCLDEIDDKFDQRFERDFVRSCDAINKPA